VKSSISTTPTRQYARRTSAAVASLLLSVAAVGFVGNAGATPIPTNGTVLLSDTFAGASVGSSWVNPPASDASSQNLACLTAGTSTSTTPVPGCNLATPDSVGSGALLLSPAVNSDEGGTFSNAAIPVASGLDVTFNSYQFNGTGSDGIAFDLAATDPAQPSAPSSLGADGGPLGYSGYTTLAGAQIAGMPHAYLGFGLDVYGDFLLARVGGAGCGGSGRLSESVTVRGPGHDINGYCVVGTTHVGPSNALDSQGATTRGPSTVSIEVALNPSAGAVVAPTSGISIPAKSWLIAYSPVGVTQTKGSWSSAFSLKGALPTTLAGAGFNSELANTADFPSSWINPTTGLPYVLSLGWTGTTGSFTDVHEVSNLVAKTLNALSPVLTLSMTDNQGGAYLAGNGVTYTLTPTVRNSANTDGPETAPVILTETFPTGITPQQPTSLSANWTCPAPSGQTITCTYTHVAALAPGTVLPAVDVPTLIDASASGPLVASGTASSTDAESAVASDAGTVSVWTATASPTSVPFGGSVTLGTSGLTTLAYGDTIQMFNGTKLLCSFVYSSVTKSCVVHGLTPGKYASVTAKLVGDAVYNTQSVAVPTFVVNAKAPHIAAVTVYYPNGDPNLTGHAKSQIHDLAKKIWQYHLTHASVSGYASSTGSASANRKLSLGRARQAAAFLAGQLKAYGAKGVAISVNGYGATHFAVSPSSSPLNRRTILNAH
jgi:outer membrane protein OmpA-like peptidoglycan-associated protein